MRKRFNPLASALLVAAGADIVAPSPVKNPKLQALKIDNDSAFESINRVLDSETRDKKVVIIKGAILSHLTPLQMIEMHSFIHDCVTGILEYVGEHPEAREEVSSEEALERILAGSEND